MGKIVKYDGAKLGAFLNGMKLTTGDVTKLLIKGDMIRANVKRASGHVQSATIMLDGRFRALTAYDPAGTSVKDRRKIVRQLDRDGHTQTAIAGLIGVSQATVSLDLKALRDRRV